MHGLFASREILYLTKDELESNNCKAHKIQQLEKVKLKHPMLASWPFFEKSSIHTQPRRLPSGLEKLSFLTSRYSLLPP